MKHWKKLSIGVGIAAATIAGGVGAAFAVWSVSGSGTGGGAASVAQSLTVTEITPTAPGTTVYPGGPAGPAFFTIANPNPFPVTVTQLTWGTPTSNDVTTCPNANITLATPPTMSVSIPVPANSTTGAEQESGVFALAHTAPDGCQGVGFNVPISVTGSQQ